MKKLSIIIVNYNTEQFLEKCLDSLGKIPNDWEVIVVDNGSRNRFKIKDLGYKIKTIYSKTNMGFAKANNRGIRESSGKFILLLNPDTIVSQDAINRVVDYLESHTDVGVATCRAELLSGAIDDASHRGFPTPWNALCHFTGLGTLFPKSVLLNGYHLGYQRMDRIHEIDACAGAFMMVRREAGDKVGWLDEDYFWYGEDLDFCYRIKQHGFKIMYIPNVSITHYKGVASGIKKHSQYISTADSQITKRAQQARFDVMRIFYEKHYKNKYPRFVTFLVNMGISMLKKWYV
ncbi:MAG: Glycosyl transferase family 2 [uncultured bacterium]|uniref:Glycosyl transferase family 2 n=3 Tax=Candidatus Roizmaniibacteriota TaxID=1752723 RepID=A0A0G0X8W1_9BACT|nr:MAG: Glycosyl transferase family 2 [uncultured bacterium]KKR50510.1 MAG: Glycosyl transferase family 2 [Candidatus Levybacteria bacterium GW2011_GWA2_40_16]KKR72574.1 MAG: Glycosyl transferase family 2 [Candidatus Roizmanbacteria bacterium GW2011_GWB1_40_7]KKR95015.1 MAG: Glycosyl transferase family 2 [Candidatus Roizmanbacteria bacterium GW2011_GWA1_41_13]KKS21370.1 MAG: Glycosyl transferase family 2 [Candidatus Roizmanbacteria bacterium GW2011_GWC2_41_7]KKS24769.1 MAG: Glycosyl transferas